MLDREMPGPDHKASLTPPELKEMVKAVRIVEQALGSEQKTPMESEQEAKVVARKSIVTRVEIPAGTLLTKDMLTTKRPGTGIAPKSLAEVVGKSAQRDIPRDAILQWSDLS
jgi:sialic acid synthase SpsE